MQSHTFVCEGVHIEDEVMVGHGVMFINDYFPAAVNDDGLLKSDDDWACTPFTLKGEPPSDQMPQFYVVLQ